MKRTALPIIVALAAMYLYSLEQGSPASTPDAATHSASTEVPALVGGRQVEASGTVVRVLSDDNDSSRHQRFILELANGHTLLIAHNIDLEPRVPNLKSGDTVHFSGQYEDNTLAKNIMGPRFAIVRLEPLNAELVKTRTQHPTISRARTTTQKPLLANQHRLPGPSKNAGRVQSCIPRANNQDIDMPWNT